MEIELIPIADLLPYANNARTHSPEQVQQIAASIGEFGWTNPVLIDQNNGIIAGHGRALAAEKVGMTEVPCIRLGHLTETQRRAYVIADNQLALNAGWDEQMLGLELSMLREEDFDLAMLGFDSEAIEKALNPDEPEIKEDEVPEPPVDPITKPGDLWLLGDHRLLCGDSTKPEDVARLMDGKKAGMMVTDPPYGVNYDPEMREAAKSVGKIANDDRSSWRDAWNLFGGDVAYVWHASLFTSAVLADLEAVGLRRVSMIIWKKPYATFSMMNYHWQHEQCWYCVRPSGSRNWVGSPKESTVWDMTQPKDPYGRSGEDKTPHPTQKPVEAMARPMRNHDHKIVYDPFLGSGTTMIAAEQLGRKCYGMEISPAYCDVIVNRWEALTGKKAVKESADQPTDQL